MTISYEIKKSIATLTENDKGYTKEINLVSWNGGNAKLDIREWHPNHDRCGKGVTLTETEGRKLLTALKTYFADEN